MAITTDNEKLAILELEDVWEPGLPLSPGALGQDDQQQLLWGYPGILWGEPEVVVTGTGGDFYACNDGLDFYAAGGG